MVAEAKSLEPLTEDEQRHIDALILDDDRWGVAFRLYRHKLGDSLNQAAETLFARRDLLRAQFPERFPTDADRCANVFETLRDISAKETVTAIVAWWDGDSLGWFIMLCAQTTTTPPGKPGWGLCQLREFERMEERATELGTRLAASLNVPFALDNSDGPYS